ncbi:MAG: hypothetical protein HRU11_04530 [Parvularculaceae bacterium]|nr:hypothetical protein [Parvularculaceae bacterium]
MNYGWDPLAPIWVVVTLVSLLLISSVLRFRANRLGAVARSLAALCAGLFLLGPEAIQQNLQGLPDQVLVLLDDSGSMKLGDRSNLRDQALERLTAKFEDSGAEVITSRFGDNESSSLGEGLTTALAGMDRSQLAGVFLLTDGRVEDLSTSALTQLPAPMHALLVGDKAREQDRQLSWISAPRFALVDEPMQLQFRIDDTESTALLPLTLRIDGNIVQTQNVPTGQTVTINVPMKRPGERIIELSIPTAAGELSTRNNGITARTNVIRDRLRVLLISGEPHAGERVWRNVLKSDPAVDLVHFTILKPANKVAAASDQELNLIPFPSRQLFLEKLQHFNVVIFDRYTYRGVITSFELAEVARYVEGGGAVLVAAGPELAREGSLATQPNLSYILPASPIAVADETPFIPTRTELGQRHPITSALEGSDDWGRWLRRIPAEAQRGQVLMETDDGDPLLLTHRLGDGRIAMLLSDHLWLWARGFDGGGPHREFLRRLVHWLMAEPELEEEALIANLDEDGSLTVTRRSLSAEVNPVIVRTTSGDSQSLALEERGQGLFTGGATSIADELVRLETTLSNGRKLTAAAVKERGTSREFAAVTVTSEALEAPLTDLGGGIFEVQRPGDADIAIRTVNANRERKAGANWAGITRRQASVVLSEARDAAIPRWLFALIGAGLVFLAWLLESGRLTRNRANSVAA